MTGGDLEPGEWSDDTAMALCLAESLVERGAFEAPDQLKRYTRWQREGYRSATGQCLGITAATARALAAAEWRGQGTAGSSEPVGLEAEALSRVAPVVMHFFASPEEAVTAAADAARLTSQSPLVFDACRLLAAMLHAALRGESREKLLTPNARLFADQPLREPVAALLTRPLATVYSSRAAVAIALVNIFLTR